MNLLLTELQDRTREYYAIIVSGPLYLIQIIARDKIKVVSIEVCTQDLL